MAEPEINQFLTHLAVKEHVSASTQNQALCRLLGLMEKEPFFSYKSAVFY
jgi:hypothetical protein